MKAKKRKDILIYIPLLIIMTISLFLMDYAKVISPLYNNHFLKQSIFFTLGLFLLLIKDKIKTKWLFEYSYIIYGINLFLLLLVLFLGESTNGAKAWFDLGFFSFQPSEIMKISLCLALTHMTEKQNWNQKKEEIIYLLKILILTLLPSFLVFLEPDTGAIIFYFLIALAITFQTKISKKWFLCLFIIIGILLSGFFYCYYHNQELLIKILGTSFFYRVERLLNFQKGLQIDNALTAIGSAPFFLFNLENIKIYIPEAPTDFAFALTSNVFGIFGLLILLTCYLSIDIFLIGLMKEKRNTKEKYFLYGFVLIFFWNQVQNIFMNLGLIPIMGIPLPFLSYGGSTTIVYFLFLAIILKKKNFS